MDTNDYMPVAAAAQSLGVRRSALYAAIKRGHFRPVEVYGAMWLSKPEVEAYRAYTQPAGVKQTGRPKRTGIPESP
jgi:hypothetical protein